MANVSGGLVESGLSWGMDYAHLNGQQYAAFGNFSYGAFSVCPGANAVQEQQHMELRLGEEASGLQDPEM